MIVTNVPLNSLLIEKLIYQDVEEIPKDLREEFQEDLKLRKTTDEI